VGIACVGDLRYRGIRCCHPSFAEIEFSTSMFRNLEDILPAIAVILLFVPYNPIREESATIDFENRDYPPDDN